MNAKMARGTILGIVCAVLAGCQMVADTEQVSRERALARAKEYCEANPNLRLAGEATIEKTTVDGRNAWKIAAEDYHVLHWGPALIFVDCESAEVTWKTKHR